MFEMFFLRHGESEGVLNGVLQGHRDYPLTENGKIQIQILAEYWRENSLTFDQIITSPLKRARKTAEIIAAHLKAPGLIEEPLWMERDFGRGEGQDYSTIADWYRSRPTPLAFEPIYDTGETEWQVHLRAGKAVEKMMRLPPGTYLIVSHGNLINAALHMLFGLLPYGRSKPVKLALDPGCYAQLKYNDASGEWSLVSFNDHLFLNKSR